MYMYYIVISPYKCLILKIEKTYWKYVQKRFDLDESKINFKLFISYEISGGMFVGSIF